jgi:hypothetical protein
MKNYKRDFLSRRVCYVLKRPLAITLNILVLLLVSLPSLARGVPDDKTAYDRFSLIITGKITDDKGLPLGEVTIAERGTNNITISKADGTFTITVVNEKAVLVISHVGYTGQEVAVKGRQRIDVRLVLSSLSMDSTIVVGYGRQKKQSLVGAISQVKGDVLQRTGGVSSLGAALTGNLPGVITVATQGTPGGEDPKIYIRGQSTWNNSDPLVLVDGIERPMNSVDIGSFERCLSYCRFWR